jgi:excisionase family DNA binding protein
MGIQNAVPMDGGETESPLPVVMTVGELARVMRLDKKTIYEQIAAGHLPGVRRCGRSLRIHRDTVLRWLADGQGLPR